jgi:non-canonical purine NTP pyrophosphatase (RdgB/HAM1 family)
VANVTFITGNQDKADFLAKFLRLPIKHHKLSLDEIQSLDIYEVTKHKARQAYDIIKSPVLVEDIGLHFNVLGRLPGAFTKFFIDEIGNEGLCRMLDGYNDRSATAEICYGYYDGERMKAFGGKIKGKIADKPRGGGGFGWNPIFIPEGSDKTYAEMNDEETEKYSIRTATVYPRLKEFLQTTTNNQV